MIMHRPIGKRIITLRNWRDFFKPRYMVLDCHDSELWDRFFWSYRGAERARKAIYGE